MKFTLSLCAVGAAMLAAFTGNVEAASNRRGISREHRHHLIARDFPTPLQDPFYRAPHNLSQYQPGEIIASRKVSLAMPNLGQHGHTYQIHYRTTNAVGHPSSSVTTVIRPVGNPHDEQLLSYHLWEDSTQRDCAPSYTLLKGKEAPNYLVVGYDVPIWFNWLLSKNITVVIPDYEGPKSALFAGFTAGYSILDSIRAARTHMHFSKDTKIGMTGYSEGAHATAWAANLAPSYGQDLNIVGVAHGGTPIDTEVLLRHFDGSQLSGFVLGGLHGLMAAYKDFRTLIQDHGNEVLKKDLKVSSTPPECHSFLRGPTYENQTFLQDIALPEGVNSFYDWEPVRKLLDRETLWNNKSSVGVGYPTFPRMIYHGSADNVIDFPAVEAYVKQQCAHKGVQIQFNVYTADSHTNAELIVGGDVNSMAFLSSVFDGTFKQTVPCGEPSPTWLNLGTLVLDGILGKDIVGAFWRLLKQVGEFAHIRFDEYGL